MDTSKLPLVLLEWQDSSSLSGGTWKDSEDVAASKPVLIRSVGWVVREDEDSIVLVGHVAPHQTSGDLAIPKSAVKRRYKLKGPNGRNSHGSALQPADEVAKQTNAVARASKRGRS